MDEATLKVLPTLVAWTSASDVLLILTCRTVEPRARSVAWEALDAIYRALPML